MPKSEATGKLALLDAGHFARMREFAPPQLAHLTQIDYDREMAFIATRK
jgi:hypothetical protein